MQRKRALRPRKSLETRLWARLRELKERGWHFRKGAPFKTFTLDFVEHDAKLVIDLLGGEPGRTRPPVRIVRDRLLSEQGYVILRLWRVEVERDLHSAIHRVRSVLEDLAIADS
jgi:crossover junction endodeoxyribonuclease RuvC